MREPYKLVLTEFIWLFIAFAITAIFYWSFLYLNPRSETLDLHLYDTYFVVGAWQVLIPMFVFIVFFLFFIKEAFNYYSRTLPNIIILITGLLLIGLLIFLNREFVKTGISVGWTSYPPLSALPNPKPNINFDRATVVVSNVLAALQIIVTASLLMVTFGWGRRKQSREQSFAKMQAANKCHLLFFNLAFYLS